MRQSKNYIGILLLAVALIFSGCRQGLHSSKKQIKKGKPIPCPIKDC
jgi:hypothetical protein